MSGHSKWATTKHKKALVDSKRSKVFSKFSNSIAIAARGGKDPSANPSLRDIIAKARSFNMPNENIDRAIKRGSGEIPGTMIEEYLIEAYGPEGIAILIRAITDNKNRTLGSIRSILNDYSGRLAETGSVQWMFAETICFDISAPTWQAHPDLFMLVIDAGATGIEDNTETTTILCGKQSAEKIKKTLLEQKVEFESYIDYRTNNPITIVDESKLSTITRLVETLDECEDIDDIHLNASL